VMGTGGRRGRRRAAGSARPLLYRAGGRELRRSAPLPRPPPICHPRHLGSSAGTGEKKLVWEGEGGLAAPKILLLRQTATAGARAPPSPPPRRRIPEPTARRIRRRRPSLGGRIREPACRRRRCSTSSSPLLLPCVGRSADGDLGREVGEEGDAGRSCMPTWGAGAAATPVSPPVLEQQRLARRRRRSKGEQVGRGQWEEGER
jgi:hypothetical protein